MTDIRFGDTIRAIPGTVTAIFAEGRTGVVAQTPVPTNDGGARGLVRWGDDVILMGFHAENVEVVRRADPPPS